VNGRDGEELLTQAIAGDHDALAALLERYDRQIRRGLRIGRKWAGVVEPDDVMQVTYVEVFLRVGRSRPESVSAFVNGVARIARQNLIDAVRREARQKRPPAERRLGLPLDDSYTALYETLCPTSSTPSRVAARSELKRLIDEAISQLPPDYATAVRLYDIEGWPAHEVARLMGRREGAVCMLRARARDRLRELLGSPSQFFSDGK